MRLWITCLEATLRVSRKLFEGSFALTNVWVDSDWQHFSRTFWFWSVKIDTPAVHKNGKQLKHTSFEMILPRRRGLCCRRLYEIINLNHYIVENFKSLKFFLTFYRNLFFSALIILNKSVSNSKEIEIKELFPSSSLWCTLKLKMILFRSARQKRFIWKVFFRQDWSVSNYVLFVFVTSIEDR